MSEDIAFLMLDYEIGPYASAEQIRRHIHELEQLGYEHRDNPHSQPARAIADQMTTYRRWLREAEQREWLAWMHRPTGEIPTWPFFGSSGG